MKRKAEEDLQDSRGHTIGSSTSHNASEDLEIRKNATSRRTESPVVTGSNVSHAQKQQTELDLDMLLDGLGMDESLKLLAKEDPTFREDLIRQIMTVPIPDNWTSGGELGFDLDDDDEDELGDYPVGSSIQCELFDSSSSVISLISRCNALQMVHLALLYPSHSRMVPFE